MKHEVLKAVEIAAPLLETVITFEAAPKLDRAIQQGARERKREAYLRAVRERARAFEAATCGREFCDCSPTRAEFMRA